ncbi:MAG TPA: IPT/TIG domain-containing protein, partial [Terracidiphilus sp.]|nr:IPT/TIG domain-containing protein [Terracidiphilus sp.]
MRAPVTHFNHLGGAMSDQPRRYSCWALGAAPLVSVVVVLLLTCSASAQLPAGGIGSISPAAARKGEQVTITGRGFGAINAKVTVGGVPAVVVGASGSQVAFLVPDGVKPGLTQVVATNPGLQSGSIQFQMLEGSLLQGDPSALAVNALFDVPPVAAPGEVVVDGIITSRLDVFIQPDATVAQVNNALIQAKGGIVSMSAGSTAFTIAIPQATDVKSVVATAQALRNAAGIRVVLLGHVGGSDDLPTDLAHFVDTHLLRARFPAAWNARGVFLDQDNNCKARVPVVVAD